MTIYTRSDWKAVRGDGDGTRLTGPREGVVLHHTVASRLAETATTTQEHKRMRDLENIGFRRYNTGIAYNAICFPSGNIGLGVSWNRRGTHTGGNNSRFFGLAIDGDYRTVDLTAAQREAIAQFLVKLWRDGHIAVARIVGVHSDFAPTACPGDRGRAAVGGINARAAELVRDDAPSPTPTPTPKPTPTPQEDIVSQLPRLDLRTADRLAVRGANIGRWQALLLAAGYGPAGLVGANGRPDNIAGAATKRFTDQFQVRHNTGDGKGRADSIVGPASWRKGLGL